MVRDPDLGALYGRYVYADLCSGAVRALQLPATASGRASDDCSLGLRLNNPVSFGEDAARRLYVVEQGGNVYRLSGLPPATCPAPAPPIPPSDEARPRPKPTFVGIKAQRRRVERGKAALLTVFVSPCGGRRGKRSSCCETAAPTAPGTSAAPAPPASCPESTSGTSFTATIREGARLHAR